MNEMMNHLGTAVICVSGSLLAYALYPDIGMLFIVSPIACMGVIYYLSQIRPGDIDHEAARGLVVSSKTTTKGESFDVSGNRYEPPSAPLRPGSPSSLEPKPSFTFGFSEQSNGEAGQNYIVNENKPHKADTPWRILQDPILAIFVLICFVFHMANATILPLVMQTLAVENGRTGILMSGMCIIIRQGCMVATAKVCGDHAGIYGRKNLFLIGLFSVPIRCALLTFLLNMKENINGGDDDWYYDDGGSKWIDIIMLSTQVLDGIGAGIFGTMYVLVTSDISGGTGRFSLTLGLTTAAMSIGGTVSGYLGQAIAQDLGYRQAFTVLGCISLFPALLYLFAMPETLKKVEPENPTAGMRSIAETDEPQII